MIKFYLKRKDSNFDTVPSFDVVIDSSIEGFLCSQIVAPLGFEMHNVLRRHSSRQVDRFTITLARLVALKCLVIFAYLFEQLTGLCLLILFKKHTKNLI